MALKVKILAGLLLIGLLILSSLVGVASLNFSAIFSSEFDWVVLFNSRIPRSLAILLTGSSLAIAGMMLQILLGNRFIEPSMVGTVPGAALGLTLVMLLIPTANLLTQMALALIFALAATFIFLGLIKKIPPTQKMLVPLIGIIYSGIIGSIATFIAYENQFLQSLEAWLYGEFSTVLLGRFELLYLSLAMSIFAYISADRLTVAGLGQNLATSLGLNFKQVLNIGLVIVSIITATVVVTIGNIAFLGLVVPNIVSRLIGDNLRQSLPLVAYIGAVLLLLCDLIARLVIYPFELSVSLVLGVVGALIFLYILLREN